MNDKNKIIEHNVTAIIPQNVQLMNMMQSAINSDNGLDKLERLMALQERYEKNEALKLFNVAMSKFQSILPVIKKNGVVNYENRDKTRTNYKHAKMEDIADAIRPALKKTGLSYKFTQSQANQLMTVKCIVTHEAGHSEFSEITSALDASGNKDGLKSIASTMSYLRRYTMTGILGIVVGGEDDESVGNKFACNEFKTIDENQANELLELISLAGMTEEKFNTNRKININSINDFQAQRFEGAKKWLNSLIEKENNEGDL